MIFSECTIKSSVPVQDVASMDITDNEPSSIPGETRDPEEIFSAGERNPNYKIEIKPLGGVPLTPMAITQTTGDNIASITVSIVPKDLSKAPVKNIEVSIK